MKLVADERAGQRLCGPGERPSHDGRLQPRATKNRPDRLRQKRGRGLKRLGQQAERHQRVREAEVGQKVGRGAAGDGAIRRRRTHAVSPGQLAGRHRRPHRARLGRPQRGQVHRRAGIEQAPEVREPPVGDGRRDEIERRGVHREQHDAARAGIGRNDRRCLQASRPSRDASPTPRAASGKAIEASMTSPNAVAASRPGRSAHSLNTPSTTHAAAHVVIVTAATKKWLRRDRVERGAEAPEVLPHQRRGGRRGGGAEPGQHAIAEPPGRDALGRQHLARDDDRVEDDGEVDAVDEQHGGRPAARPPGRPVEWRGSDATRARRRRPRRRLRPAPRWRASGESARGDLTWCRA